MRANVGVGSRRSWRSFVAIITVVIAIIAFIWAGPMVVAVIAADCAIISATISIIQAMPTAVTIQTIVIGAFDSSGTLSNNPPPPDQQARIKKDAVTKLRDAMTAVQSSSALHQQATNVDITQATATSDQTSRALQKLLGALRRSWAASRPVGRSRDRVHPNSRRYTARSPSS